ncbi:uncharacterized protein LOC123552404 [Mercenaria mercenaria]|uniref:uncharacterized protein LOC123552404 n=1 Tax=Mercenaria mercenaria TaxID=6596 RepID=UPI00234E843A|nr:uncharacterized protein LOC123552404 [Mercenaria mercenaria]
MEKRHGCQWNSYTAVLVSFFLLFQIVYKAVAFSESNGFPTVVSTTQTYEDLSATTAEYYYYDYYQYQYDTDIFKVGSDHCKNKSNCTELLTFPDKLCHCDKLCGLLNDCCGNYGYISTLHLTKDQFECVPSYEIVKNREYGITMVTKCSPGWDHNITKTLCEDRAETNDKLLRLPVSDKTEFQVMFKNMYCAQCNFVNDFYYWKQEILCKNDIGVRGLQEMKDCILFFIRPQPDVSYRTCLISQSIISTCDIATEITYDELSHKCSDGVYAITYDESGKMYRNKYCAMCSGVSSESMFCEQLYGIPVSSNKTVDERRLTYSLRLVVDINTGIVSRNKEGEKMIQCKENEMYDGFSQKCREIYCAPPLAATNGVCKSTVPNLAAALDVEYNPILSHENCTLTKVDPSEYEIRNNSITNSFGLFLFSHRKIYSMDQLHWSGSDVFICLGEIHNCSEDCKRSEFVFHSDAVESYLTLVGLVVSILSLTITLVVYIAFPQLLNTPGKILVSLIVSLLLAQIFFLSASNVEHLPKLCVTVGVLVHYFFLAAFCWMNVIAFDLWMTFSNRFMTPGSDRKGRTRFFMYSLYAWLLPVVIVCTAVILDFVNSDVQFYNLKPGYGNGVCWISSRNALILFFAGPLAVFKIFDIISFISTAVHIARAKKQGAMATRKKNTCSFIVNIKLSLIMGLTWAFAFVANATNETSIWYMFIIFNSLQGLFIAICFLLTKKVGRLISDKYQQVTTKTTSGTQITSLA